MIRAGLEEDLAEGPIDSSGPTNAIWADMIAMPAILNKAGNCMATPLSVASAIASLENFLPGLKSGNFCIEEILAIHRNHACNNGNEKLLEGDLDKILPPRAPERSSSWRYQGVAQTVGTSTNNHTLDDCNELTLPTKDFLAKGGFLSEKDIWHSFKKFDITGDHKLTFMSIKTALDLYNSRTGAVIDDSRIREWIRENDPQNKGYVDFDNYRSIFLKSSGHSNSQNSQQSQIYSSDAAKRVELLKK